ncbi:unnamed protein product, partial [Ectocarpus sp. 8 AP-2014]
MFGVLECIPREPVYVAWPVLPAEEDDTTGSGGGGGETRPKGHSSSSSGSRSAPPTELPPLLKAMSGLLRCLAATEWLTGALTLLTRWAHSRGAQTAAGQQAASRWGAILVSGSGRRVLERLMRLHRNVLMEFSRAKAEHQTWLRTLEAANQTAPPSAEGKEQTTDGASAAAPAAGGGGSGGGGCPPEMPWPEPDFFRINVVAQDGALVGSGLDSDGSVAVHTVECGTVVVAYERAANSAGVMRYRTRHGWISEHARGTGRQPIVEILSVGLTGQGGEPSEEETESETEHRRRVQQQQQLEQHIQQGGRRRPVHGLRATGCNSLARLHTVTKQLVTAFARVLAGSLPRPHHREDLTPNMNPVAPAVCEFLSESLREGFALGLDRTEDSR